MPSPRTIFLWVCLAGCSIFCSVQVLLFRDLARATAEARDDGRPRWGGRAARTSNEAENELRRRVFSASTEKRNTQEYGKRCNEELGGSKAKWPLITVTIPSFKGSGFIARAVRSVLDQTYPNIEVLVSVDYSPDTNKTVRVLEQFMEEPAVKVHVQTENLGWIRNYNFLTTRASGDYVTFLADDDYVPPHMYTSLYDCFRKNAAAVNCYPYVKCVGDECDTLHPYVLDEFKQSSIRGTTTNRIKKALQQNTALCIMKGLVKRHPVFSFHLKEFGTDGQSVYADLLQIVQFAIVGELIGVPVPYYKHFRSGSTSHREFFGATTKREFQEGAIDLISEIFHVAYTHASSEDDLYESVTSKLRSRMNEIHHSSNDPGKLLNDDQVSRIFRQKLESRTKVAVLGGGIQGVVMALLFRKHGYDVAILDQASGLLQRASNNGVNRVHLGMEYSKDETMRTGEKMLEGALRFASYIEYLLGERMDWSNLKSSKHQYLVPHDSLLKPDDLEAYFSKLEKIYQRLVMKEPSLSYLGARPNHLYRRISVPSNVNATYFEGAFESEEYSISFEPLRGTLKRKLGEQSVDILLNTRVYEVIRNEIGYNTTWVTGMKAKKFVVATSKGNYNFDLVVNCLWENRYDIDQKLGWSQWSGNNLRLKFGISTSPIEELADFPSTSIVNGPFGDYVNFQNEGRMYFSWYPISRSGMVYNNEIKIPNEWKAIVNGSIPSEIESYQLQAHESRYNELFLPGVFFRFECPKLFGGFILGNGEKDVDKMDSVLHERADYPIRYEDGYWSISTQKFTTAPYNAYLLEKEYLKTKLAPGFQM